jgi:hypothetical protein
VAIFSPPWQLKKLLYTCLYIRTGLQDELSCLTESPKAPRMNYPAWPNHRKHQEAQIENHESRVLTLHMLKASACSFCAALPMPCIRDSEFRAVRQSGSRPRAPYYCESMCLHLHICECLGATPRGCKISVNLVMVPVKKYLHRSVA